jgi:hypothetical protein
LGRLLVGLGGRSQEVSGGIKIRVWSASIL